MALVKIAGLDGSKRNFGCALMTLDTDSLALTVDDLVLVKTEKDKSKQVRAGSDNLKRAHEIVRTVHPALTENSVIAAFVEVPSGGQSYDAVLGFGIVIGIYAGLPVPVLEVSPSETKLAAVGTRTASKEEMIQWATEKFPTAPWLMTKRKGVMTPIKDNEHLADAVAIVHAGIRTPAFRQSLAIINARVA